MRLARTLFSLALATLASLASLAVAGEIKPYNAREFDELTQAGKSILVDVSATWCPTCKAQKPILDSLMQQPAYRDVAMMTVDFDTNGAALKRFKVRLQSTLIAFKGTTEVGRSVGDTTPSGIESLIKKTVN